MWTSSRLPWRRFCDLPPIFRDDSRHRDFQESRANQGGYVGAAGIPLLAGAGSFTTLLSLRAEYASVNIIVALILNMLWVYFVVRMTRKVERVLGKGGIYLIRKFFGIILLAISVKLFMSNITLLMEQIEASTKAI